MPGLFVPPARVGTAVLVPAVLGLLDGVLDPLARPGGGARWRAFMPSSLPLRGGGWPVRQVRFITVLPAEEAPQVRPFERAKTLEADGYRILKRAI